MPQAVKVGIFMTAALVLLGWLMLRFTKFGRLLYAVGGNQKAAYVSGVRTKLYKVITFVICGGLVGFGIVIILSSLILDRVGYKPILLLAFLLHLLSAVLTLVFLRRS